MAESYLRDQKRVFACAVYLEGEYGYKDLYMGVPCIIGGGGMERVLQVDLDAEEKAKLEKSAEAVRGVVGDIKW
jgi:malate dehydrogenase